VTQNLDGTLQSIVMNAGKRANNMVATMFSFIAKEKFGDPLKVKTLGEAYREYAATKAPFQGVLVEP
jgi:hypothetical protein